MIRNLPRLSKRQLTGRSNLRTLNATKAHLKKELSSVKVEIQPIENVLSALKGETKHFRNIIAILQLLIKEKSEEEIERSLDRILVVVHHDWSVEKKLQMAISNIGVQLSRLYIDCGSNKQENRYYAYFRKFKSLIDDISEEFQELENHSYGEEKSLLELKKSIRVSLDEKSGRTIAQYSNSIKELIKKVEELKDKSSHIIGKIEEAIRNTKREMTRLESDIRRVETAISYTTSQARGI